MTLSVLHSAHSENYYLVLGTWLGIHPHSAIAIYCSLSLGSHIELRKPPDLLLPLQIFRLDRHLVPFGILNVCSHQRWCIVQLHRDHTRITRCSCWQLRAVKM